MSSVTNLGSSGISLYKAVGIDKVVLKNKSKGGLKVHDVALTSTGGSAILPMGKVVPSGGLVKLLKLKAEAIKASVLHMTVKGTTNTGCEVSASYILPVNAMDKGVQFQVQPIQSTSSVLGMIGARLGHNGVLTLAIN